MNSDNFSFKNFDWLKYMDKLHAQEQVDANNLREELSGPSEISPTGKSSWVPMSIDLPDGSRTLGFRLSPTKYTQYERLVRKASEDPAAENEIQKVLLKDSDLVLTTPSLTDRMRGMKANTIIAVTPSSMIDLMDDQVPDLREGFFTDGQDPSLFAGAPSLRESLLFQFIADVAGKIVDQLTTSLNQEISIQKLISALKQIGWNMVAPATIFRFWRSVLKGDLIDYIKQHPDMDIYGAITSFVSQFFWGNALDPSGPEEMTGTESFDIPGQEGVRDSNPPNDGRGQREMSSDIDAAYIPLSYWRRLYAMGSTFRKRNAIPSFSNLLLTGDPEQDLCLNRVPRIYIHPDGRCSTQYWRYGCYPMAGGLFKKIGAAVKKVAKGVAKGVSKVMNSPLGGVISAIPGVGNIASVAGKVANTALKVMDKVEAAKSALAPATAPESDTSTQEIKESTRATGLVGPTAINGLHSQSLPLPSSTTQANNMTQVQLNQLPKWEDETKEEYVAPPLAFLTGDPDGKIKYLFDGSWFPLEDEYLSRLAAEHLYTLQNYMVELDRRGPSLVQLTGSPAKLQAAKLGGCGSRPRKYWVNISPLNRLVRRLPTPMLGDPDLSQAIVDNAAPQLAPMAEWLNLPSLTAVNMLDNPLISALYQIKEGRGTAILFNGSKPNLQSLKAYLFNVPSINQIKAKGEDEVVTMLSAIEWAMLVTSCSLNDSQRDQVLAIMSKLILGGAPSIKGIEPLLALILDKKWPTSSEMRDKNCAVNWTRLLAAAIVNHWVDATPVANELGNALVGVRVPSLDMVKAFLMKIGIANDQRRDAVTPSISPALEATSWSERLAGGSTQTPAQSKLDNLLAMLGSGADTDEVLSTNSVDSELGPVHTADMGYSPSSQFDVEAGDYWALAMRICRTSLDSRSAAALMRANDIPSFIISQALMRCYPKDNEEWSPMAAIPLSRKDYLNYIQKLSSL